MESDANSSKQVFLSLVAEVSNLFSIHFLPLSAEGLTAEINLVPRTGNNHTRNGKVWKCWSLQSSLRNDLESWPLVSNLRSDCMEQGCISAAGSLLWYPQSIYPLYSWKRFWSFRDPLFALVWECSNVLSTVWSPVVNTKCFPEISLLKKKIKIKMGDWLLIISVFIRASCGHRQNKDCNRAEEWESSKDTRSDFSGGIALREAPLLHWGMDSLTLWADDLWPSGSEEGKQLWEHKCSPAVERGEAKGCALQYPTTLWAGCTTVSLWGQVHPMLMKELNKNTSSCCLGLLNCLGRVELSATALTLDFFTPGSQSGMLHTYLVSWWIQWRGRFCLWSWRIDKVSLYILSHTYIGIQTLQRICELSITVLCMGSNTSEFLWCWSQLWC